MPHIEVIKDGKTLRRQSVDAATAKSGCVVNLGSAGKATVKLGETATVGGYEVSVVADADPAPATKKNTPGQVPRLEGYEIHSPLGEGGMGVVWKGVQLSTKRPVALKFLGTRAFGSEKSQRRFEREVEIAAKLEHPHIARVYDSGIRHGVYYYAMELIAGMPLDQFAKDHSLDQKQILELMRSVCQAVQYAHQRGVIHRDLKPGNILATVDGQPHVLDFGLAKELLQDDSAARLNVSVEGEVTGTASFMSPEQAAGKHQSVDVRTDVYSLGVILYRLLTGKSPHDLSGARYEVIRRVAEEEVIPPRQASDAIDKELEALLLKALAHTPEERYASAGDFSQDIDNYLKGEPLTARPATTVYFLKKRLRKYRLSVSAAAGVFLLLLATGVWSYARVKAERNRADDERADAVEAKNQAESEQANALAAAEESRLSEARAVAAQGQAQEQEKIAKENAARAELELANALIAQADVLTDADRGVDARALLDTALQKLSILHVSPFYAETALWNSVRASPPSLLTFSGHTGPVRNVAFSPDGRTALSGSEDHTMKLWDIETGRELRTFTGHSDYVNSVAFSPDGHTVLSGGDKTLKLWDVATGRELRTFSGHTSYVTSVAFSPDGHTALSGSDDSTLKLWDLDTGRALRTFSGHTGAVRSVAVSPDGRMALSGSEDDTLKLWDIDTGRELRAFTGHTDLVMSVAFSPDGHTALSCGDDATLKLWDIDTGRELRTFVGHTNWVEGVAFNPNGHTAISGGWDNTLKLWDIDTGRVLRSFAGHTGVVFSVTFSPDGRTALSGSKDQTLTLWDIDSARELRTFSGHAMGMHSVAISPDGRTALSGSKDHTMKLWDIDSGRVLRTFTGHTDSVYSVAFSPDGQSALSGGKDFALKLWDIASGRELKTLSGHKGYVASVAFSRDGNTALSGSGDNTLKLWDIASGRVVRTFSGHTDAIQGVAFSPDGHTALSGSWDKTAKLWDIDTGRMLRTFAGHADKVTSVAFSPDGHTALSGSWDKTVKLWDIDTGRELQTFWGHGGYVYSVVFTPDGHSALSGSGDSTMKLWDVGTGREVRSFSGHTGSVISVALSPDGRTALSGSWDHTLKLWDFSRTKAYREFAATVPAAQKALAANPSDGSALAVLGEWYAFRGLDDWAVDLLEKARGAGAAVPALTLGQSYWELSDDLPKGSKLTKADCLAAAQREYAKALAEAADEKTKSYLNLCLSAIEKSSQ